MKEIIYQKYRLGQEGPNDLLGQLVECYREVFAAKPWREWKYCNECKGNWGKEEKSLLESMNYSHCGAQLVDYWPPKRVQQDIQKELTSNASCWLAMDGEKLVGFCWGYPITRTKLSEKLGIDVQYNLIQDDGMDVVAHQDEVGVLESYRGRKIASTLVSLRAKDFLGQGLKTGIVRTRKLPEPSVTYVWYKRIGYTELAHYDDGRVILGRGISSSTPSPT